MGALDAGRFRDAPSPSPEEQHHLRILRLENRLQRERAARLEAEAIAEKGLRELYEKQQQLALLERIATMANQSTAVDETLRFAIGEICRYANWPFGHVFKPVASGPLRLVPTPIWWAADQSKLSRFIADTQATEFLPATGLPGRVLSGGNAAWISDLRLDANCPRASVALACGLGATFAFPVLIGDQVAAVMEFFFRQAAEPNQTLLGVMSQIGMQLGRVIERKQAEDRVASHDPLTGLPNRLLFLDRLAQAVARRKGNAGAGFAVLFIDLDRFKMVNDSLGHAAGDVLLIEIARRLADALQDAGSGASPHTLARLGGDEFTILLEDMSHPGLALETAERLQETFRKPVRIEGQQVYTSASIGVASSAALHATGEDLMRNVDLAMYRAKSEGRARIAVFDQGLHDAAVERLRLESDMRDALRANQFVLHYQPIVALDTRRIVGFEALVRWQRTPAELVPPARFIDIAEENGLIVPIGAWVLRQACRTMVRWRREFPRQTPLSISVNVSPRQFSQPDFVDQVREAVTGSGLDPGCLGLEITESMTIRDTQRTVSILDQLRRFGVHLSIDDFGTGYSSLSYLHRLPINTLKIDRLFINALGADGEGSNMIRTILDLARNLKMDVVAEGTETRREVDSLHEMGCQFAQGYYFSMPVDAGAAADILSGNSAARTLAGYA